jgi:hypothetical protein
MLKRITILGLMLCLALAGFSQEQTFRTKREITARLDAFMQLLVDGDNAAAFGLLAPYWPFGAEEVAGVRRSLEENADTILARYGDLVGYELAEQQEIGSSLLRFTYLAKYERHALRWSFDFYRPEDRWLLNSFWWDDSVEELF